MLNPEVVEIEGKDGVKRKYTICDVPYMSGGREICSQFVSSAAPKIGDYKLNEALAMKMFNHIYVDVAGNMVALSNSAMIDNHVPDFITGVKLESAMIEKNLGFSVAGKIRKFQQQWKADAPELITKTLTLLLRSLQQKS